MAFISITALCVTAGTSFLAGIAITKIYYWHIQAQARTAEIERKIEELSAAQAKHLPYSTAEEIENSVAALLRLKDEADFRQDLIENALNHLRKARNGNKK